MEATHYVVYKIENPEGGIYIGRTKNLNERITYYKRKNMAERKDRQRLIGESMLKYGFDKHSLTVIDSIIGTSEDADKLEVFYIDKFKCNSIRWPEFGGLNLSDGGKGNRGHKHTQEYKDYMSKIFKGRVLTTKEGRKRGAETRLKNGKGYKAVDQYDKKGNFIKSHRSISLAAKDIGTKSPHISAILAGKFKYTKGFTFKYSNKCPPI